MTVIKGPTHGHSMLEGSSDDDTITARGDYNTIVGGGGNDTISSMKGNYNYVSVGTLSDGSTGSTDTIRIGGSFDTVVAGDENINLTGTVFSSSVSLGAGNNTISLKGSGNTIETGGGINMISALGGSDTVSLNTNNAGYTATVKITGQNNIISADQHVSKYTVGGSVTITGGSGFNTILLDSAYGTISLGGAANSIESSGYSNETIFAGSGSDTVGIAGSPYSGGSGTASVFIYGQNNYLSGNLREISVSGGNGDNNLSFSGIDGNGRLTATLGGYSNNVSMNAMQGLISAGSGSDTVTFSSAGGTVTFHGADDRFYLDEPGGPNERDATILDRGVGLTITLDSGPYATGNLLIDHLDSTGLVDFNGRGGFGSAEEVVSDLKSTGKDSYSLVLPDGSGTISFSSTNDLSVSNFAVTNGE